MLLLLQGRVLGNTSYSFDFRETSSRFRRSVVQTVRRASYGNDSDFEGKPPVSRDPRPDPLNPKP